MNPAWSVVVLTAATGVAQGLAVVLAVAVLAGVPMADGFVSRVLFLDEALLAIGLAASFGHLGRPERAWRAAMMWRTSWLSREVIVLPAFMAVVASWWWLPQAGWLALLAIALAALLWTCTAMIYACLRFIEEWAQPLTLVNFVLLGLASGSVLAAALAAYASEAALLRGAGRAALVLTLAAWLMRALALRRNRLLVHRSTLQSATGIRSPRLAQQSMGMSAGSFNTREFFHGRTLAALRQVKLGFILFGYALPLALAAYGLATETRWPWALAVFLQVPGVLADRWFFFAQARHPQNLYYQVVS